MNTTGINMSNSVNDSPTITDITTRELAGALAGLEFGSVVVTVHHGRIVQIERREKVRLDKTGKSRPSSLADTEVD